MSDPYRWPAGGRTRRDTRPINDPATAAGLRGVHRDMRGNVIGGYTAEGVALGTKRNGNARGNGSGPGFRGLAPALAKELEQQQAGAAPAQQEEERANPLGGGLAAWHALNPKAMSATERLRRETPPSPAEILRERARQRKLENNRNVQRERDKEQLRAANQAWA